jgi:hypothetical protein
MEIKIEHGGAAHNEVVYVLRPVSLYGSYSFGRDNFFKFYGGNVIDSESRMAAAVRPRKGLEGFRPAAGGAGAIAEPRKARSPRRRRGDAPIWWCCITFFLHH